MKKYLILTSVVALAACNGGSGDAPVAPVVRIGTVSAEAAQSNTFVTNMSSEIGVADDGSIINADGMNRASVKHFTYNNKEYKSYRLDDVHFWYADNVEEEDDMYLTFDVDEKGKITKVLEHEDGNVIELGRNNASDSVFVSVFQQVYKYQPAGFDSPVTDSFYEIPTDKDKLIKAIQKTAALDPETEADLIASINASDEWQNANNWRAEKHKYKYDLKGNLSYADFGYIKINGSDISVIAGGYQTPDNKITNIDKSNFNDKIITFHGTAVGAAGYSYKDSNDIPRYKSKKIETHKNAAELIFDNGTEKLTMPFNDYYTVTVETGTSGYDIKFKDYPSAADVNFKLEKESVNTVADENTQVRADYYGPDKTNPSEVVGTVYHEQTDTDGFNHEFQAAFGVKQ